MTLSSPDSSRSARVFSVLGCCAAYILAFVTTHLPPSRMPGTGLINDKLLHGAGFFALGVATLVTISICRRGRISATAFWGAWGGMLCYALLDESTQPIVGRTFEWGDLAADGAGALLGAGIVMLIVRTRR